MRIKSIISSSIGNILEWYDFGLFAIFSPLFSEIFFPKCNGYLHSIETLTIFAIGFICRPLGALVFGYLGDKRGRVRSLRLSVLMISIPTLLLGFIPTYQQAGLIAPICLLCIRIWQGFSLGGEFSGNIIYLAETAPKHMRATLTSFASTGANLGILLATLIGTVCVYIFSPETLKNWGWRLPYILSGILSITVYMTRLKFHETAVFEYMEKKKLIVQNPIETAFEKNYLQMLRTLGLVCLGSTYYYFCFIYLPLFLSEQVSIKLFSISALMTVLFIVMLFLVPMSGLLCDFLGRRKMLIFNASMVVIFIVPCFYLIETLQMHYIILGLGILTLISCLEQATTSIAVVENFPTPARYTGLSFSYNLGNGFLGGTVPLISTWLISHTNLKVAPAFYVAGCAMITLLVAYFFVPETKQISMRAE